MGEKHRMRIALLLMVAALGLCVPGAAIGQSWNSRSSVDIIMVGWALNDQEYTFTVTNPVESGVLAWSLEPFNVGAPVDTDAPDGWMWDNRGGWKAFEIASDSTKYTVGGPAIEPGESVTFVYKIGESTTPVNKGGPAGGQPAFLVHVAAVGGNDGLKWRAWSTDLGGSWYDAPTPTRNPEAVSEPGNWLSISLGIFALGCLRPKRAGV